MLQVLRTTWCESGFLGFFSGNEAGELVKEGCVQTCVSYVALMMLTLHKAMLPECLRYILF